MSRPASTLRELTTPGQAGPSRHSRPSPSRSDPRKHVGGRLPLVASLVGLATLYGGLEAISLAIIVLLAATYVPASTLVRRLALATLAVFGLNAAALTALALAGASVDGRVLATAYLLAFAALSLAARDVAVDRFASLADWCAAGAAVLAFAALYRPFVGASPGRMMAQLSYASDTANHLTLVRSTIDNGGYLTTSDYPPAWAGNVAMVVELFLERPIEPTSLVTVAAPVMVAFYALLVFFAVALPLDLLDRARGQYTPMVAIVTAVCVGTSLLVGPALLVIRSGSYPQLVSMTSLIAITSLLVSSNRASWQLTALMGLLTVTVMQTWYLLAPVLVALVLLYVLRLRPPWGPLLATAAVVVPVSAYPLWRAPAPVPQINALGIAIVPPLVAVVALLLVTLGAVFALLRPGTGRERHGLPVATLAVATLATTVIVMALQALTGGPAAGYYGAKMLHAVFVFGTVAAASAAAVECARAAIPAAPSQRRITASVFALVVVGVLGGSVVATSHWSWPYAAGRPPGSPDETLQDGAVLDVILAAHPNGLPPSTDAWVAGGCNPRLDHILSKWTHDLFQTWTTERRVTNHELATGDLTPLAERAATAEVKRVEVYVDEDCKSADLLDLERTPEVVVVRVP